MLLKYIFLPELHHKLPEIMSLLNDLNDKDRITEYLQVITKYILTAANLDREKLKEAVRDVPKGVETVETTASRLRQEGFDEGVLIGEARGEAKGIQFVLVEVLLERFGMIHQVLDTKIKSIETTTTLKGLFRQALKVESIQEFNRILDRLLQPL